MGIYFVTDPDGYWDRDHPHPIKVHKGKPRAEKNFERSCARLGAMVH